MKATLFASLVLFSFAARAVVTSPEHLSRRIDYAIAYVPFLHSVIMHGGWAPPDWVPTSEAWKWDGHRWSPWVVTGSPAFAHHTMVFDFKRNVLVLCGRAQLPLRAASIRYGNSMAVPGAARQTSPSTPLHKEIRS